MLLQKQTLTPMAREHFKLSRDPFTDDVQSSSDVFQTSNVRYVRTVLLDAALHHGFVAVTGESGAGKSTLADIVMGLLSPDTGAFLIVVAAGILCYGIHELQEIGLLPFLTDTTYDVSGVIPDGGFLDTFLRGTISFRSAPSQLESLAWFAYLIPTAVLYFRGSSKK